MGNKGSKVDKEIADKVKSIHLDNANEVQPDVLIRIPNGNPDIDYEVNIDTAEFTSVCPLNVAQPDYATIKISYIPGKYLVELKSLKFYLASYRNTPIFHEEIAATILKDLSKYLEPKEMKVIVDTTVRGGIHTVVTAYYYGEK